MTLYAYSFLVIFLIAAIVVIIICSLGILHWLDFLYTCSYIKLGVTLTKYIPQVWLNYQRKSTVGWSIENIILDFTGGILSILQMIFNSYNYSEIISRFIKVMIAFEFPSRRLGVDFRRSNQIRPRTVLHRL